MIARRSVLGGAMALAAATPAHAQQAWPLVGFIAASSRQERFERAFVTGLRDLGFAQGRNVEIEFHWTAGTMEPVRGIAAGLIERRAAAIVTGGGNVTFAVRALTSSVPIVFATSVDPVADLLVASLARPGGNVTGITTFSTELDGKRLELFKEAVPKLARIAFVHDPGAAGVTRSLKETIQVAARSLKLVVEPWEIRDKAGLEKDLAGINKLRVDGIYAPAAGGFMNANAKRITDFALKSRLPTMVNPLRLVAEGGLMGYAADERDRGRRVAYYIDRILKGTKPADLPVEQPTKFEFVINLKTAKQIGVMITPEVLARATRIIR